MAKPQVIAALLSTRRTKGAKRSSAPSVTCRCNPGLILARIDPYGRNAGTARLRFSNPPSSRNQYFPRVAFDGKSTLRRSERTHADGAVVTGMPFGNSKDRLCQAPVRHGCPRCRRYLPPDAVARHATALPHRAPSGSLIVRRPRRRRSRRPRRPRNRRQSRRRSRSYPEQPTWQPGRCSPCWRETFGTDRSLRA